MKALDKYLALQKEIFNYFGYHEDWVVIPIDDRREMYWQLLEPGDSTHSRGSVMYHIKPLTNESVADGETFEDEIYTQRFLPKWVYRGEDYTMICVNPRTDGNKFLAIFNNAKEQKDITARFNIYEGIR
jgi:hypothetical protein